MHQSDPNDLRRWASLLSRSAGGQPVADDVLTWQGINQVEWKPWSDLIRYGEIYVEGNAAPTVVALVNTWYQVTVFGVNGESNLTTPDHTNDHITIDTAGKYLVLVSAAVLSGAGAAAIFECEVKLNNGVTGAPNVHWDRRLVGGGGDEGSTSGSGIVDLSATDTVELWIQNKTNAVDVTFEDVTLTVVQVGT